MPGQLSAAIEESNRAARSAKVPDQLNMDVIDPEKASAFVAALQTLPPDTLKALAGKTVFLNHEELMLASAAPTLAAGFRDGSKFAIADVRGDLVLLRFLGPVDCKLAQTRASETRAR